jgi:hypothetical protein
MSAHKNCVWNDQLLLVESASWFSLYISPYNVTTSKTYLWRLDNSLVTLKIHGFQLYDLHLLFQPWKYALSNITQRQGRKTYDYIIRLNDLFIWIWTAQVSWGIFEYFEKKSLVGLTYLPHCQYVWSSSSHHCHIFRCITTLIGT